jgi:hypothetical protein
MSFSWCVFFRVAGGARSEIWVCSHTLAMDGRANLIIADDGVLLEFPHGLTGFARGDVFEHC